MNAMRITLRATPEAVEALEAKSAAQDKERIEREREFAARPLTPAKPQLAVVATLKPEKPKKVLRLRAPKPWTPELTWAGGLPIILPCTHDQLGEREGEIANTTLRAVARMATTRPGDAARMAAKLEAYLGVTMAERAKVWAPVREMLADLGSPNIAADVAELAGVKPKRGRGAPKPKKAAKKKQAVKFSDGATPERARKSRLVEEPIYAVDPSAPRVARAGSQDALPPPKMILLGRAQRDQSLDPKTRLGRYRSLETQHISAGVRFSTDFEKAGLEPRLTANLLGTGGGSGDAWAAGLSLEVMRARDRVHSAVKALWAGGADVVHTVEGVVLNGESATVAASGTYTDKPRASAHVAATLKVGLNLLDQHYNPGRYRDRSDGEREEKA